MSSVSLALTRLHFHQMWQSSNHYIILTNQNIFGYYCFALIIYGSFVASSFIYLNIGNIMCKIIVSLHNSLWLYLEIGLWDDKDKWGHKGEALIQYGWCLDKKRKYQLSLSLPWEWGHMRRQPSAVQEEGPP